MEAINKKDILKIYCPKQESAELFKNDRLIWFGLLWPGYNEVDLSFLHKGVYILKVGLWEEVKEIKVS